MILQPESLSFIEIASRWAAEDNDKPRAATSEEILSLLLASFWRGDFEDGEGQSVVWIPSDPDAVLRRPRRSESPTRRASPGELVAVQSAVKQQAAYCYNWREQRRHYGDTLPRPYTYNRRRLLFAKEHQNFHARSRLCPYEDSENDHAVVAWNELRETTNWEALAGLKAADYEEFFLFSHLLELHIARADFREWCESYEYGLPAFWFAERAEQVRSGAHGQPGHSEEPVAEPDPISERIQQVIDAAQQVLEKHSDWSTREIAEELAPSVGAAQFADYRKDSIADILDGRYGPARKRGFTKLRR